MKRLALLAALSGCLSGSNRTAALATTSTAVLVADWIQTRGYVANCQEANPVLGKCGENFPVDVWFPVAILTSLAIGAALNGLGDSWGDIWLGGVTGVGGATVWGNAVTE